MPEFSNFSLLVNIALFALAAVVVWIAGSKIAIYADEIAERTGIGRALLGLLLLAGVTSLPEVATSFTAAASGNAALAVNNLLGSISLQVAVLAVADMIIGKRALTALAPDPIVMLQAALNVCLLSLVAAAILVGDRALLGAGIWSWALVIMAVASFWKITDADGRKPWVAKDEKKIQRNKNTDRVAVAGTNQSLAVKTVLSAISILLAGFLVASSGEAIAEQSGLGASFMGVAFIALATSLPEISTVVAAMRRRLYTMAISDILGTNILNVALLFGVDIIASGDPVLNRVGNFAILGAMIGVVVTGLFLAGLAERRDRTLFRMGTDSILVLLVYFGGLGLLYTLRGSE